MADKKENLKEKIIKAIRGGEQEPAAKLVARYIKAGKLDSYDKLLLSKWYTYLGEPQRGLKVIGKECGPQELDIITPTAISVQARLSFLLGMVGARYASDRLHENTKEVGLKRDIDLSRIDERWPIYQPILAQRYGFFKQVPALVEWGQSFYSFEHRFWHTLNIVYADSLIYKGDYEEAIRVIGKTIEHLKDKDKSEAIFNGMARRCKAMACLRAGMLQLCHKEIQAGHSYFNSEGMTKEQAELYRVEGEYYLKKGDKKKAETAYARAFKILSDGRWMPQSTLAVIHGLEQCDSKVINWKHSLALRAHITFNFSSFLVGKKVRGHEWEMLPKYVKDEYQQSVNDCWKVEQQETKGIPYSECSHEGKVIDLHGGVLLNIVPKKKIYVLSEVQRSLLSAVIRAGGLGLNQWCLVDFIYRQDFFHYQAGYDRLKNLIAQFKKKGVSISVDKHYYFFDWKKDQQVILPMADAEYGLHHYVQKNFEQFDAKTLEEHFQVHRATVNRWIKEWREAGLVIQRRAGRKIVYEFPVEYAIAA